MSLIYGNSGDVRELIGSPTETEISASLLNTARTKATNLIDTMLERKFPDKIPFTATADVPLIINSLTDDIAVFYIYRSKHRGIAPLSDDIKSEYWDKPMDILK